MTDIITTEIKEDDNCINFIRKGIKGAVVLSYWKHNGHIWFNYHAVKPQREGQNSTDYICEYLGVLCYCDGRTLGGRLNDINVFKMLEVEYESLKD